MRLIFLALLWAVAQTTRPAEPVPATRPVQIDESARQVLDDVRGAYAKLTSLELVGTMRIEVEAAGRSIDRQAEFSASFAAPNRFRHEMTDDALIVSDGTRAYLYVARVKRYDEAEAPAGRSALEDLSESISQVLRAQNPSLLAAICEDASAVLLEDARSVRRAPDQRLDGGEYQVIKIDAVNQSIELLIDPTTHLLRRVRAEFQEDLAARGVPDAKRAVLTIDYPTSRPDIAIRHDRFAWTPPPEARPLPGAEKDEQAEETSIKPPD